MNNVLRSSTQHAMYVFMFGLAFAALMPAPANAQTFESNANTFETPMGMGSVTDIDSPTGVRRDQRFNLYEVQEPGWRFAVTSIGNLINVETNGSNNSIVINATQVNNGNQSASFASNEGLGNAMAQ
jgi:holdfast attachment protein HfaA